MRIGRAAAVVGLELHLGLVFSHTHLWQYTNAARRARLAATQQLVARQLHALLGEQVASVYTELDRSNQLALQEHAAVFVTSYLQVSSLGRLRTLALYWSIGLRFRTAFDGSELR